MPIYFSIHQFCFYRLETLGKFIKAIGPFPRQYITRICFFWGKYSKTPAFDVHQTFRLLSACPKLKDLVFFIHLNRLQRYWDRALPGQRTALQIRGIKDFVVRVTGDDERQSGLNSPQGRSRHAELVERLSVLKLPYTDAETRRREARGIIKKDTYRTSFDGTEQESRAQRYKKRKLSQKLARTVVEE
ncbi:MAG: hypothetical protein Q9224_007343 [Gallowayella concinna]